MQKLKKNTFVSGKLILKILKQVICLSSLLKYKNAKSVSLVIFLGCFILKMYKNFCRKDAFYV